MSQSKGAQLDLIEGLAGRDIAINTMEVNYTDWMAEAREKAVSHARDHGSVTSDDIYALAPMPPWIHHNAMGAVFRDKRLKIDGYVMSKRPSAHARRIAVYALR